MFSMSWCAYIELTVSLVEAAKALSQGAENGFLGSKAVIKQLCTWTEKSSQV